MIRKYFRVLPIAALAMLSVACSSDDNDNSGVKPGTTPAGSTVFSVANADVRTVGKYGTGQVDFYWSSGDNLWVDTTSTGTYKSTASNSITSTTTGTLDTADFYLIGTFRSDQYPVRYTGNASTSADQVTIAAVQTQAEANNAVQMGEVGDCGTGTAYRNSATGKYTVELNHKASYITFTPYYSTEELASSVLVTRIVVEASSAIAGTYAFSDSGLGTATSTTDSIVLNLVDASATTGFTIPTTGTVATNAALMVLAPGTYSTFIIKYTLYDTTTGFRATVKHTYSGITLSEGRNYPISVDLKSMRNYSSRSSNYYTWDATAGNHYWLDYESSQPTLNGETGVNYPDTVGNVRWYNTAFSSTDPTEASQSCASTPSYNEWTWYMGAGSPSIDNTTPWIYKSHLYTGGMWMKKWSKITGFTDESNYTGSTAWSEGGYSAYSISISGMPSDTTGYVYLPAMGQYKFGKLTGLGTRGYYWSRTPNPYNYWAASCFRFATDATTNNTYVRSYYERHVGMQLYKISRITIDDVTGESITASLR